MDFTRRPSHQTYVTPVSADKAREELVMERYNNLSYIDKVAIDQQAERIHQHYLTHNFKPEPSLLYRLELVFLVGTWLNENDGQPIATIVRGKLFTPDETVYSEKNGSLCRTNKTARNPAQ
jgi:hypothetical protein